MTHTAITIEPIYVHKENSSFYITDSADTNSDRYRCFFANTERMASVFSWEELLAVLRKDHRLENRKIVPMF